MKFPWRRDTPPAPERIEPKVTPWRVSANAAERFERKTAPGVSPFVLPKYAPGVIPDGAKMAMDEAGYSQIGQWAAGAGFHGLFAEGIGFFGYPYLAELSQRPEYRTPSEILAEEMTRKWLILEATGTRDKSAKITQLTKDMVALRLREAFRDALMLDGLMGISMIYPDLMMGDQPVFNNPDELGTPLILDKAKIAKGSLRGFKVVDPLWIAPTDYDSRNPLDDTFYKPQTWFITGLRVSVSRLLIIRSRPVPDLLKPAYNFGGIALSQMLKPYVDNWLRTRQSVSNDIAAFTTWVLKTNLATSLGPTDNGGDGGASIDNRLAVFAAMLNNRGVLALDKDTEDFANISFPLGTLDALQAQSQEHMSAVTRIPLLKSFGFTPTGLNTSTSDDVRTFYDTIHAYQENVCNDQVKTALDMIQLNRYGEIDPEITHRWLPLWELDSAGQAAVDKTKADTAAVYMQEGVVDAAEVRTQLAADPMSPYHGLKGPPPEPPEPEQSPGSEEDDADKIDRGGAEGSESGANSGV